MGKESKIAWTESTWNPVTGCTKVSAGCKNCYAESLATRFKGNKAFPNGFDVTLKPHKLNDPKKWKEPRRTFVNSLSDLFHKDIPESYIREVFKVMEECPHHTFQVLTKRPIRMAAETTAYWSEAGKIPDNIWFGVSIEDNKSASRVIHLSYLLPAKVKFISFEPLLENLTPYNWDKCTMIADWAILGGESGKNARPFPMDSLWAFLYFCRRNKCAAFVKQLGEVWAKSNGASNKKGESPDEWPKALTGDANLREYPE